MRAGLGRPIQIKADICDRSVSGKPLFCDKLCRENRKFVRSLGRLSVDAIREPPPSTAVVRAVVPATKCSTCIGHPAAWPKTRRGTPCQCPAMANGRCKLHGGKSTGAPLGNKNALKHGFYTAEAVAQRRRLSALLKESRELLGKELSV